MGEKENPNAVGNTLKTDFYEARALLKAANEAIEEQIDMTEDYPAMLKDFEEKIRPLDAGSFSAAVDELKAAEDRLARKDDIEEYEASSEFVGKYENLGVYEHELRGMRAAAKFRDEAENALKLSEAVHRRTKAKSAFELLVPALLAFVLAVSSVIMAVIFAVDAMTVAMIIAAVLFSAAAGAFGYLYVRRMARAAAEMRSAAEKLAAADAELFTKVPFAAEYSKSRSGKQAFDAFEKEYAEYKRLSERRSKMISERTEAEAQAFRLRDRLLPIASALGYAGGNLTDFLIAKRDTYPVLREKSADQRKRKSELTAAENENINKLFEIAGRYGKYRRDRYDAYRVVEEAFKAAFPDEPTDE